MEIDDDVVLPRTPGSYRHSVASAGGRKAAENRRAREGIDVKPHPCMSDEPYTEEGMEFLKAIQAYKRAAGKPFLTTTEYLHVLLSLGYSRNPPAGDGASVAQDAPLTMREMAERLAGAGPFSEGP